MRCDVIIMTFSGEALNKEEYERQVRESEELSNKLESALSNQLAEGEAYRVGVCDPGGGLVTRWGYVH